MFQTQNFERLVINGLYLFFLHTYFHYPEPLENWPGSAYSFWEAIKKIKAKGGIGKIEY